MNSHRRMILGNRTVAGSWDPDQQPRVANPRSNNGSWSETSHIRPDWTVVGTGTPPIVANQGYPWLNMSPGWVSRSVRSVSAFGGRTVTACGRSVTDR